MHIRVVAKTIKQSHGMAELLSCPNCLRMLQEIARGIKMKCADLCEFASISQLSMFQQLKELTDADLVESRKESRNTHLALTPTQLQELENCLQLLKTS